MGDSKNGTEVTHHFDFVRTIFKNIYIIIHLTSTRSTMYGLLIFLSKINGLLDINKALIVN